VLQSAEHFRKDPHILLSSTGAQALGVMSGTPSTAGTSFPLAFPTALPTLSLSLFNHVHIYSAPSVDQVLYYVL
jgi:hypothetical protein